MLLGAPPPCPFGPASLPNHIGPVIEGTGLARIKKHPDARRTLRDWDEAVATIRQVMGPCFPAVPGMQDWRAYAEGSFIETPRGLFPSFDLNLVKTRGAR